MVSSCHWLLLMAPQTASFREYFEPSSHHVELSAKIFPLLSSGQKRGSHDPHLCLVCSGWGWGGEGYLWPDQDAFLTRGLFSLRCFLPMKWLLVADQFSGKFSSTPSLLISSFLFPSPSKHLKDSRRTVKQIPWRFLQLGGTVKWSQMFAFERPEVAFGWLACWGREGDKT